MNQKKIVVTGGPSTGKTSVIKNLEKKGFACLHELIRTMTSKEKNKENEESFTTNPIVSVNDPKKFNQKLLKGRIEQYKSTAKTNGDVVFFDRGIPDVHAYMNCFEQSYGKAFEDPCYTYRYDKIVLMPPWREIYVIDNERFESFEESLRIYECLKRTYESFGYSITVVPKGSVENRTNFILDQLSLN